MLAGAGAGVAGVLAGGGAGVAAAGLAGSTGFAGSAGFGISAFGASGFGASGLVSALGCGSAGFGAGIGVAFEAPSGFIGCVAASGRLVGTSFGITGAGVGGITVGALRRCCSVL